MPIRLPPDIASCYFRAAVGVVLLAPADPAGHLPFVLKARRTGSDQWQMPQGGIDPGESPLAAARRELAEELGIPPPRLARTASFLAEHPRWLTYEIPESRRKPKHGRGQTQRWFYFRYSGPDEEIDHGIRERSAEFDAWAWTSLDELIEVVWAPKRPVYEALRAHLATLTL